MGGFPVFSGNTQDMPCLGKNIKAVFSFNITLKGTNTI